MAFNKIAEAYVEIKGDKGKFSATIRGAKRETADFARSAGKSLKRVGVALGVIATAATVAAVAIGVKLTKAIIRAGTEAVKTAVKYDRLKIGLIAITGSAKEAERQLARLRILALAPGLGFEQAIQGSTALQAAGISAQLAERSLAAFGNALAIVGKGADDLTRVNLQLSQIAAKTSGFGRDLLVIREAVPSIGPILTKAFNDEPLENMTIAGEELIKTMVAGLEGLGKAGESVGNNLVNLGVSFDLLKNEIGKAMLSVTSDTVKSLTGIIDTITAIIPFWKDYQDQIGTVFGNIIIIGIRSTSQMLKSIGILMVKGAPLVWKPLLLAFRNIGLDIDAMAAKLGASILKGFRIIDQATFDQDMKAILERNKQLSDQFAVDFAESWDESFGVFAKAAEEQVPAFTKALLDGLKDIQLQFDILKSAIPKAVVEPVKKAVAELSKIKPKDVEFLILPPEDPAKAEKRLKDSEKRILKFRDRLDRDMQNRQALELENFRTFLEERRARAEATADAIRPAFENMFEGLFSGKTKGLWKQFWEDLKRIAIRQLAIIATNEVFKAFSEGGFSFGGGGGAGAPSVGSAIGSGLGAIAGAIVGNIIAPGIGGGIGAGIGANIGASAVGGSSQRGIPTAADRGRSVNIETVNVNDQDLTNFDTQRMTTQVQRALGPAFSQAAIDGITS